MNYKITHKQLACINIMIRVIQEIINRGLLSKEEEEKIIETINKLTN